MRIWWKDRATDCLPVVDARMRRSCLLLRRRNQTEELDSGAHPIACRRSPMQRTCSQSSVKCSCQSCEEYVPKGFAYPVLHDYRGGTNDRDEKGTSSENVTEHVEEVEKFEDSKGSRRATDERVVSDLNSRLVRPLNIVLHSSRPAYRTRNCTSETLHSLMRTKWFRHTD